MKLDESTEAKLIHIFRHIFVLEKMNDDEIKKLTYQSISEWDSLMHILLVSQIEDQFSFPHSYQNLIEFNSFSSILDKIKRYERL